MYSTENSVAISRWIGIPLGTVVLAIAFTAASAPAADLNLRYGRPMTDKWSADMLPLGNGELACTVYGSVQQDRLQFNVDSLWTGNDNPTGDYRSADFGDFQNFGEIIIGAKPKEGGNKGAAVTG